MRLNNRQYLCIVMFFQIRFCTQGPRGAKGATGSSGLDGAKVST